MPQEELLLYDKRPSPLQIRTVSLIALSMFIGLVATLAFAQLPLPKIGAVVPAMDTILSLGDLATAVLLLAQASVLGSRALAALAIGYFFTALLIIPHALTFPGLFPPLGLLGGGVNTAPWLYIFWHVGLPLAVIAYVAKKDAEPLAAASMRSAILAGIAGSIALVLALTLLTTVGEPMLPRLFFNAIDWSQGRLFYVASTLLVLLVAAMAILWRRRQSILDLWLMLVLWAWMIELILVMTTSSRFTVAWYSGRLAGTLSGLFVLIMLLAETGKLYARLALAVATQQRERAARLMTIDAVSASIAHEVKQPLTAIRANADAGLIGLRSPSPDLGELSQILKSINSDARHASDVVGSISSLFGTRRSDRIPSNLNDLIRETTALISRELTSRKISLRLQLSVELPAVAVDRIQMQHVFLNLFSNAIEAMSPAIQSNPRVLYVQSVLTDARDISIKIEDTGAGLAPANVDRIFDPFFTTKPHGTGMGLSFCRSIVEAHGGRLVASPRVPFGATFQIQLPCAVSALGDGAASLG